MACQFGGIVSLIFKSPAHPFEQTATAHTLADFESLIARAEPLRAAVAMVFISAISHLRKNRLLGHKNWVGFRSDHRRTTADKARA